MRRLNEKECFWQSKSRKAFSVENIRRWSGKFFDWISKCEEWQRYLVLLAVLALAAVMCFLFVNIGNPVVLWRMWLIYGVFVVNILVHVLAAWFDRWDQNARKEFLQKFSTTSFYFLFVIVFVSFIVHYLISYREG